MRDARIIVTIAWKHFRILSRSRATLAVIFLPGIVLYTIFTQIFAGPAGRPFKVAVIDRDGSAAAAALIDTLAEQRVKIITTRNEQPDGEPLTEESACESIRRDGKFRVALVIPPGFGEAPNVLSGQRHRGIVMYFDETQETEAEIVTGLVQMAAGRNVFEQMFGLKRSGRGEADADAPSAATSPAQPAQPRVLIDVDRRGVAIRRMVVASKHTFLAGIVPMFLLFLSAGAGRGLLDEITSGTIRRQLAAPIHPAHIVLGQQVFAVTLGIVHCYVMYLYAWAVFGVAIWDMTAGLFVLTVATCMATTGFGILLGALSRTGEQLDSIGTMANLAMSAIGGSMVPRWIMPEFMQKLGLLTINGWSYDGFIGLIRNEGLTGTLRETGVLLGMAALFATAGCVLLTRRLRAA
jgi:ABC-2 type transport system permease protein